MMAHTQDALSKNIIDLTDDYQEDSLQLLSSAASRAGDAASRLANNFGSAVLDNGRMYLAQLTPPVSNTMSDSLRETPAKSRIRRQAAVHASHTLTEVYKTLNPLEEKLQASTTTPKKLGRPKKDEWTPSSHGSRSTEESDVRPRYVMDVTGSPTSIVTHDPNRRRKVSMEGPSSSKKRKRSSLSPEQESPSKLVRTAGLQIQDSLPGNGDTSRTSSSEPSLSTSRDCQRVLPRNFPNFRVTAKSSFEHYYTDPDSRLPEIIQELISTALDNQKRRYKYTLPKHQLRSICKAVSHSLQDLNLSLSGYTDLDRSLWRSRRTHCHLLTYMASLLLNRSSVTSGLNSLEGLP